MYEWSKTERYLQLRAELVPRIHAKIAAECEDTAELAGEVARNMLGKFAKDYKQLEPRDQAGAIRNVATVHGIEIDKPALLRGQPTEIVEHRHDVGELGPSSRRCSRASWMARQPRSRTRKSCTARTWTRI